ncbi:hypothetical protein OMEGA_53 [Klebsiella phage vB_KaeM_KaOmega]|nr:hypothetical protein OMEGA_53 [Klebsiella phage vB_KaeM_KaOmega]
MKRLMSEDEVAFRKHWKSLKKDVLIDKLWEMLKFIEYQAKENDELRDQATRANTAYLSRCRSVGGVTLPPGV